MTRNKHIRVFVADDHPVFRRGVVALLEEWDDMKLIGEASDGEEAVELCLRHRPDVTLLDLRMPKRDGVACITAIREKYPGARVIVLTTYDSDEDIYRTLRAGANAYLLKDTLPNELLETIRAVHAGHTRIPPVVAAKLAQRLTQPELTQRELDVLRLLVAGGSNKSIEKLLSLSASTVKTHLNHIFQKLAVNDRIQAVITALKRGLVHLE